MLLFETMNIARAANKYFNDTEPWKLIKENKERCETVINICLEICHSIAISIYPFLPFTAEKILKILNKDKSDFKWNKIGEFVLKPGTELGENEILFPQIEDKQIEDALMNNVKKMQNKAKENIMNIISIDDFKKIDLKVAKVIECEIVPKSKKLLKLKTESRRY